MKYALGIDIGGTNIKIGLVDFKGKLIGFREKPTKSEAGFRAVMDNLVYLIKEIKRDYLRIKPLGLGVGLPGWVDNTSGTVFWSPNLRWTSQPFSKELSQEVSLPVLIENDASLAALGEHWKGSGGKSKVMLMLTLGTGVGAGLIVDGSIYNGASGMGIEAGHLALNPIGPVCSCGGRGCLESYTSVRGMLSLAKANFMKFPEAINADSLTIQELFSESYSNYTFIKKTIEQITDYLAYALVNLILVVDPDKIIIGGGVAEIGQVLLSPIRKKIACSLERFPNRSISLTSAALGNKAGVIGAAYQVFKNVKD